MDGFKLVVVGDGGAGKTTLLIRYATGEYPHEYTPTVFECYTTDYIKVDDHPDSKLKLSDTGGGEDYHRLRPLCYPETDIFLLCFSVEYHSSFYNILSLWDQELSHHCPNTPIILVGNKTDLRDDQKTIKRLKEKNLSILTYDQGVEMAEKIGAKKYLECSSLKDIGVKTVFEDAIRTIYAHPVPKKAKKKKCKLL